MNVFEKVTFRQFYDDFVDCYGNVCSEDSVRDIYDGIKIPQRSTAESAGYDFYCPYQLEMKSHKQDTILTGIRVVMDPGNVLLIFPRSGLATKHGLILVNTIPVIDADYYKAKNEGHIKLVMKPDVDYIIGQDERVAQGIIMPFVTALNGNTDNQRVGGFGSTGV